MALISGDKRPIILVPDNTPMTALGCIGKLDWLLVPGVPVAITDQVAEVLARIGTMDTLNEIHRVPHPWHGLSAAHPLAATKH